MNLYGPTHDLKIDVGHCDLYFMSDCVLYLEDYLSIGDHGSLWQNVKNLKK